jgi:hypothetical protein
MSNISNKVDSKISKEELVKHIHVAWQKTLEGVLETAQWVKQARKQIDKGWDDFVENELPFSPATARKLMSIADHSTINAPENQQALPHSWSTLYQVSQMSVEDAQRGIDMEEITPNSTESSINIYRNSFTKPKSEKSNSPSKTNSKQKHIMLNVSIDEGGDYTKIKQSLSKAIKELGAKSEFIDKSISKVDLDRIAEEELEWLERWKQNNQKLMQDKGITKEKIEQIENAIFQFDSSKSPIQADGKMHPTDKNHAKNPYKDEEKAGNIHDTCRFDKIITRHSPIKQTDCMAYTHLLAYLYATGNNHDKAEAEKELRNRIKSTNKDNAYLAKSILVKLGLNYD